jgi:hypothetical protein
MRFLLLLIAIYSIAIPVSAQTDTSYRLLWYKGKKIKPNLLLTPLSDTIRFDPVKRTVKVTSKKSAAGKSASMLAELNKTSQRIEENIKIFSSLPKIAQPAYVEELETCYLEIQEEVSPLLSNTLTLPDATGFIKKNISSGGKGASWDLLSEEPDWKQALQELRDDVKRLNAMPLFTQMPEPPFAPMEYGAVCRRSQWSKDIRNKAIEYAKKLKADEEAVVFKALLLSNAAQDLNEDEQKYVQQQVNDVLTFLHKRVERKISSVVNTYGDIPNAARGLMLVIFLLQSEHEAILPEVPFNHAFAYKLCDALIKGLEDALERREYAVGLNVEFYLKMERYCQMAGYEIPNRAALREKFFRFNQFRLDLHIAGKVQGPGGTIETELKGKNWFMAIPNRRTCRLDWILVGPDLKKLEMDMVKKEMVTKVQIPYVGGKKWQSTVPEIKVDFYIRWSDGNGQSADAEVLKDSIIVHSFYEGNYNELWKFPPPTGVTKIMVSQSVLLGSFMDVERLKQEARDRPDDMKERAEKMKEQMMKDYAPLIEKYQGQNGARPPMSTIDFKALHHMQQKSARLTQNLQDNLPGNYVFIPAVSTQSDPLIIDEKLDGKKIFPQNAGTVFAWFKLRLEHDPNGPYNNYRAPK